MEGRRGGAGAGKAPGNGKEDQLCRETWGALRACGSFPDVRVRAGQVTSLS